MKAALIKQAVEFYFDFGSPTTYLAWTQLRECAPTPARSSSTSRSCSGGSPGHRQRIAGDDPAKGRYMGADLPRFARRYGVPFAFNRFFPINTMTLMRIAAGLCG